MEQVKNKRALKQKMQQDPYANAQGTGPIRHKPGTKPARRAKKYAEEMSRKHSKKEISEAHEHMKKHMR
jgi:hypothetical protein